MRAVALDLAFAALADPTRRAIVARLASGDATVSDLAAPFKISPPAISRHLRVLERAALIRQERQGKFRRCSLNIEGLRTASQWLDFYRRFWSGALDRLDEHIKATAKSGGTIHGTGRRSRRI